METMERRAARRELVRHRLQGQPWHVAAAAAGLYISRATAYLLLQRLLDHSWHDEKTQMQHPPQPNRTDGGATASEATRRYEAG
jgi:hypothetical protein